MENNHKILLNGRRPIYFYKWKTTSFFWQMEDDIKKCNQKQLKVKTMVVAPLWITQLCKLFKLCKLCNIFVIHCKCYRKKNSNSNGSRAHEIANISLISIVLSHNITNVDIKPDFSSPVCPVCDCSLMRLYHDWRLERVAVYWSIV